MFNRDGIFNSGKGSESTQRDTRLANSASRVGTTSPQRTTDSTPDNKQPTADPGAHAPKHSAPAPDEPRGSRLIVGPDIKLKGVEITDCDTLVVEGRVEASMDSRVIRIADTGIFVGKVGIDVADIVGRFEGELTARTHLVIHSTGKVSGKIRYGRITIEDGGEVSGDISAIRATADTGHPESKGGTSAGGVPTDIMTPYDPFSAKSKPGARTASKAPEAQT